MTQTLGEFLRDARAARGWSQSRAAEAAGIGRVTLSRWESSAQSPRVAELSAFLAALGADGGARTRALALLPTAEGRHRLAETQARIGTAQRIGPMPCATDLLRALRLRRGVPLDAAAKSAGVTTRTLRLWENGEVEPSPERLAALCVALHAHPRETAYLLARRVGEPTPPARGCDELRERFVETVCYYQVATEETATELEFVTLAAEAWHLAARHDGARLLLAEIHGHHAHYLSNRRRHAEAAPYTRRSLDLLAGTAPDVLPRLRATILAVRCDFHGGWLTAKEAEERMRRLLSPTLPPELQAWIIAGMATYAAHRGTPDDALPLTAEAYRLAGLGTSEAELLRRRMDYAQGLLMANRAAESLDLLSPDQATCGETEASIYLLRARAQQAVGTPTEAAESLREALARIARFDLAHMRAEAEAVARLC